jgi:uncharacterized membrane protein YgcG
MADSNVGRTFFYVENCVRVEVCSTASWKNARVWDWSADACLARLKTHLMTSGLHKMDEEEANFAMLDAVVLDEVWPEQAPQQSDHPPPSKKARGDKYGGGSGGGSSGSGNKLAVRGSDSGGSSGSSGSILIPRQTITQALRPNNDFAH